MASVDLKNVLTDVLPGLPLPSEAAKFIFCRLAWIREGEEGVFDLEAPLPWNRDNLCTLAFLISNQETYSARLMVANLLKNLKYFEFKGSCPSNALMAKNGQKQG